MKTEIIIRLNDCITDSHLKTLVNKITKLDDLIECVESIRERKPIYKENKIK